MRGAVEAVAADVILFVILIGNGIHERAGGASSGGRRCRTHPPWDAGHDLLAGLDAGDVGGVVEGGQGDALLQSGHYGVVDEHGAGELLAAMDHAVSDGVDLGHALDHAVLGGW